MGDGRCATCEHWQEPGVFRTLGICQLISDGATPLVAIPSVESDPPGLTYSIPHPPAVPLLTAPDFGCVAWYGK